MFLSDSACCYAATANCLACQDGKSVADYCQENPDTEGCASVQKRGKWMFKEVYPSPSHEPHVINLIFLKYERFEVNSPIIWNTTKP